MIDFVATTRSDPLIDFSSLELPQATYLVGGHLLSLYQLVNGVPLDAEIGGDFVDREPSVFDPHQFGHTQFVRAVERGSAYRDREAVGCGTLCPINSVTFGHIVRKRPSPSEEFQSMGPRVSRCLTMTAETQGAVRCTDYYGQAAARYMYLNIFAEIPNIT